MEPSTGNITIKARMLSGVAEIAERLASLQMFTSLKDGAALKLLHVESRDIQKRPYLFIILTLEKERFLVDYTIAQDTSPKLRRLSVLRDAMGVLALVTDLYQLDNTEMLQYAVSAIDDFLGSISQNYSAMYSSYDALVTHFRDLKHQNIELESSNKELTATSAQLQLENDELRKRIKALETYSDESLMVLVQDWLEAHGNSIDLDEFSKAYKVVQPRVEQILNKMISLGYVEVKE